jgi:hypothetical protein
MCVIEGKQISSGSIKSKVIEKLRPENTSKNQFTSESH